MYEITEQPFESYEKYKSMMDITVNATVVNIVKIGYLLKVARDTGILEKSGYTTMRDFAQTEYNIDASTASRFIGINDRYSMGGNSMELDEKYAGFETSKLAEMLTLPDSIIEEIPAEMKRDEIREIKGQLREEEKVSDMEVLIEKCETEDSDDTDLAAVLRQTLEENYEMFRELDRLIYDGCKNGELYDIFAPAGYAALIGRIPGKGRMMLSIKSKNELPVLINTRTGEKEEHEWDEIFDEIDNIIKHLDDVPSPEEDYKATFGHSPKAEEKKPSAVTVSEKAKPKTDKKPQKAYEKPEKAYEEEPKTEVDREKVAEALEKLESQREEPEEAAGVTEEIAPAQSELTPFQRRVIDKLKLIESIVGGMETTKENWDKVNDMLRETITLINRSTF